MVEINKGYMVLMAIVILLGGLLLTALTLILRKVPFQNKLILFLKKLKVWHILTAIAVVCIISLFMWPNLSAYIAKRHLILISESMENAESLEVINTYVEGPDPKYVVEEKKVTEPTLIKALSFSLRAFKYELLPDKDIFVGTRDSVKIWIYEGRTQVGYIEIIGGYILKAGRNGKLCIFTCKNKELATNIRNVFGLRDHWSG